MGVGLVVGAVWVALALGLGLLLARAIRAAEGKPAAKAGGDVGGDPLAAPRPAAPVSGTAGGSSALPAPRAAGPFEHR